MLIRGFWCSNKLRLLTKKTLQYSYCILNRQSQIYQQVDGIMRKKDSLVLKAFRPIVK